MQQPTYPLTPMSSIPTANIATDQIQKCLDENKQLILAILENQNLGKLAECAQYQAQLQKNLLNLAAIADAQPNAPAVRAQMMPHGSMPQESHYMQQAPFFPLRAPLQQMQEQQLHQQTQGMFPVQMGIRPGAFNGMHSTHTEPSHGGSGNPHATPSLDKQGMDTAEVGAAVRHRRSSGTEHGSGDADQSHVKRP